MFKFFGYKNPSQTNESSGDSDMDKDSSDEFLEAEEEQEQEQEQSQGKITSSSVQSSDSKPILFVSYDSQGKFHLEKEAANLLCNLRGPIGILSVCGISRSGKSYILNRLHGRSNGFEVGPTQRSCTKGLWIWSTPIRHKLKNGKEFNLILLDTEGINAPDQTAKYSTQIFSLAILLSSVFVYNQMGTIDESALNSLSLITKMVENIRIKANSKSSIEDLSKFSPHFIWLLRDFYLDLSFDKFSPNDYLEDNLKPQPGNTRDIAEKNEIRSIIKGLFPERDCFTLVRPVQNESSLRSLATIPPENLRKEFIDGVNEFVKCAISKSKPKTMGNVSLTGTMFVSLTHSYLDALNRNAVPSISSSWRSVEEIECRRATDCGIEEFEKNFDKSIGPDENLLNIEYQKAMDYARLTFDEICIGSEEKKMKYEEMLTSTCSKKFEEFKTKIITESENVCMHRLNEMQNELLNQSQRSNIDINQLFKILEHQLISYDQAIKGSSKWRLLLQYICNNVQSIFTNFINQKLTALQSEKLLLESKVTSLKQQNELHFSEVTERKKEVHAIKSKCDKLELELSKTKNQYLDVSSKHQKTVHDLERKVAELRGEGDKTVKESIEWRMKFAKMEEENRRMQNEYLSKESNLNRRLGLVENERDQWKLKYEQGENDRREKKREEIRKFSEMKSKSDSDARECATWQKRFEESEANRAKTERETSGKITDLNRQLEIARLESVKSQNQIQNLKLQLDSVIASESGRFADVSQQLTSMTAERNSWVEKCEDSEKNLKIIQENLSRQLAESNRRLDSAQASADTWQREIVDLQSKLVGMDFDVSQKEHILSEWKVKNQRLTEKVQNLTVRLDETEKEAVCWKDKVAKLESQIDKINSETSEKSKDLVRESKRMQRECDTWKEKWENLHQELTDTSQKLTNEKRILQLEIDSQQLSMQSLKTEMNLMKEEKEKWDEESKKVEVRLGGEREEKEKNARRCDELQMRVDKLNERFSVMNERLSFYKKEAEELEMKLKKERENGVNALKEKVTACEKTHVTIDHLHSVESKIKERMNKEWQERMDEVEKEKKLISENLIMNQGEHACLKRKVEELSEKLLQFESEMDKMKSSGKRVASGREEVHERSKRAKTMKETGKGKEKKDDLSMDDRSFESSEIFAINEGDTSVEEDENNEAIAMNSSSKTKSSSSKKRTSSNSTPISSSSKKKGRKTSVLSAGIDLDDPFNKLTKAELKKLLQNNNREFELYDALCKEGDHKYVCINLCKKFDIKPPN